MSDVIIQRTVFPTDLRVAALYYRAAGSRKRAAEGLALLGRRSIRIERGAVLDTCTYFNSFFEAYWRRYTRLGRLALRLQVSGQGTIRLYRRTAESGVTLVDEVSFEGDNQECQLEAPGPRFHFRELGSLYFTVAAGSRPVTLHQAEWVALGAEPAPVTLVAGYCTFNREQYLLDNVRLLCADADAVATLGAIVVVDQGTRRVKAHPAFAGLTREARAKLRVIEQGNFGGSGGFTRSILEGQKVGGATHMLLMDDDAVLEPESVFRAARFLSLAQGDVVVGGNMLDLLRPNELYELNVEVDPRRLVPLPLLGRFRVDRPKRLKKLLEVHTTLYNAWWFMAFPLNLVDRLGLPLPFFIRCDDIEFGCRLNRAGVATVALPGVAVWHEPFYLKHRGWQNYYDLRNMLAVCAVYFPLSPGQVVGVFLRCLLQRLMTHDYGGAWMVGEAFQDYLRGPQVLESDPQIRHQRLLSVLKAKTEPPIPGTRHLHTVAASRQPRFRLTRRWCQARCLLRQLLRATPPASVGPDHAVRDRGDAWWHLARTDVVAVRDKYAADYAVLRRSRTQFLRGVVSGGWMALRLLVRHRGVMRQWQTAFGHLTSPEFWHRYLGLDSAATEETRNAA